MEDLKLLVGQSVIEIKKVSVLEVNADVIVNAANHSLLGGGGVDGAIHKAAGPKLLEECRTLHGCQTGKAKITKAYNLTTAKWIIHTVGPIFGQDKNEESLLESCYLECLKLAEEKKLSSIAFPCISAGVYGCPIKLSAKVAIDTIEAYLKQYKGSLTVSLACFKDSEYEAYKAYAKETNLL